MRRQLAKLFPRKERDDVDRSPVPNIPAVSESASTTESIEGVPAVTRTTPPSKESLTAARSMTEASLTTAPKKPFVVRVSGIHPGDYDTSKVKSLVKTIAKLSNSESDCVGDITVVPSCADSNNLVALIDFKMLPDFFSSLKEGSPKVCKVPGRNGYFLAFDARFLGFTQMYSPATKPTVE